MTMTLTSSRRKKWVGSPIGIVSTQHVMAQCVSDGDTQGSFNSSFAAVTFYSLHHTAGYSTMGLRYATGSTEAYLSSAG